MLKEIKPRKCKVCANSFVPTRPLQKVCSSTCAYKFATAQAQEKKTKAQRKELREAKERIKSRGDYAREAQIKFNAFIRARDEGNPCISCDSFTGKKNAGHYRSVGSCPELRFEESQVHLQCEKCNSYLSGNLINYRINLIKRIGIELVDWIEGPHEPQKYTIEQLREIKATYSRKARELKKGIE